MFGDVFICCVICAPNAKLLEFTTIILSCYYIALLTLKGDEARLYYYCCWLLLFLPVAFILPSIVLTRLASVELPVRSRPCSPLLVFRPLGTKGVTDVVVFPAYVFEVPAIF